MKKWTFSIALLLSSQAIHAQLVFNELMQSNIDCIMDDLNEFPDSWVELYNTGTAAVNLKDWRLGLSDKAGEAWQLSNKQIGPGEYALVYCDKVGKNLHTDFRLESGKGGSLYLFQGQTIVDKVEDLPKQPAPNIAYGRKTDGSNEWGYQLTPTPEGTNTGEVCDHDHILGEPVFSEPGKVFNGNKTFNLQLSLPEGSPEGTEIRYTTNGSEPTASSAKYTADIPITKSTSIRAKLFCNGWLSPRSTVQSYIFHDRSMTIPVISIVTDNSYLNDKKIGIFANNYGHEKYQQVDWRRPLNIELFDAEGEPSQLNQLCEMRITGAWSREAARKSMGIYCHKRFGKKNMEYEFFPDQCPGLTNYKSIVLRNSGNDRDYTYMRDAVCQRAMAEHADIDWQAWRPAVIYINGNYWCLLNIRERANENNILTHYDGLEDIDLIENGELKEGTKDNYDAFTAFFNEHGHTLDEYAELMDWEEYIRITTMNLYFNNLDYPGNNNVMWRPRAEGGKWRWIAKDLDYTLGLYTNGGAGGSGGYDHQIIAQWYNPDDYSLHQGANFSITWDATRLFRRLMEDADFAREFIDRFSIYMGDFLNEKSVRAIWDPMYTMIKDEWKRHRSVVYDNPWWPIFDDEQRYARNWLSKRTNEMYKQLGKQYDLGTPIPMTVNQDLEDASALDVTFNGVPLTKGVFNGKFFADRSITLEGQAPEGQVISGWTIVTKSSSGTDTRQIDGERCALLMPQCTNLAINAILSKSTGIDTLSKPSWTWQRDGDRLILSGVPVGTQVKLYDLKGILLRTVTSDGSEIILPLTAATLHVLRVGAKTVKL
ncbi:MAG: hypothetical protein E7103_01550 [Prevotella sp.]|nr:hypothetical protein [Prevotella sp.]